MKKYLIFLMILILGLTSTTACSFNEKSEEKVEEKVDYIRITEHGARFEYPLDLNIESIEFNCPEVIYNVKDEKYSKVIVSDGVLFITNKDGEPMHVFSDFSIDLHKK